MKNPKQNRMNPKGELVATSAYGTFMGNRGVLHDGDGRLGHCRWRHKNWIICRLEFKGRKRRIMAPNRYTELFFLDEATAMAAGHRPCAECRYDAYRAFRAALERAGLVPLSASASDLDARLHEERAVPRSFSQRRWTADIHSLPKGTMVEHEGRCLLVAGAQLLEWSFQGYRIGEKMRDFPGGRVTVLTPRTSVCAIAAGYNPALHESALQLLPGLPAD